MKDAGTEDLAARCVRLERENAELRGRLGEGQGGMARYLATLQASGDMMSFIDREYRYRAVNEAYVRAFGRPRRRIEGRTVAELFGEETFLSTAKPKLDQCLSGEEVHFEHWFSHPASGRTYRAVTYRPYIEQDGSVAGVIVHSRDITERKLALDALTESERRYRMLFERGAEGVLLMDRNMTIREANPRALELLGYAPSDLAGRRYEDLIHPESRRSAAVRFDAVLAGETVRIERVLRRGTGGWMTADVSATLIGENIVQLMFVDVSERKRMEEALVRARAAAEEASRVKSDFLARMSHELRTPIAGILAMAELAAKTADAQTRRQYLGMLGASGRTLLELVDDILDLSKIEAGRLEILPKSFEVRETVHEQAGPFLHLAREKGLAMSVEIGCGVPEWAFGDPLRFAQILRNLLSNAVKFTERGRIDVVVSAQPAEAGSHMLRVCVRDTGMGIPDDKQHLLFKSFSQIGAAAGKLGGTGLGLAISKQLAEKMGGSLWVESRLDEGSAFNFTVHLGRAEGPEAVRARQRPDVIRLSDLPRLRVLVVEDNEMVRLYLEDVLREAGHEVLLVEDGDRLAAACAANPGPWDAVLMDINMPGMDGLEATRLIRQGLAPGVPQDVPVLALTAYAMQSDRDRFLAAGLDDHLPKPVTQGRLALALQAHCLDRA